MDSQERHELQENDLATFLSNFGEWWEKYGNTVLIVVMAVVLVLAGWRFFTFQARQAHEEAWADLALATSPEALRNVAETHDDESVRTLAYLHGADLLLGQALTGEMPVTMEGEDESGEVLSAAPRDRETLLTQAETLYQEAIESSPHDLYMLNARLGLASVAETQQRWDHAQSQYEQIVAAAGQRFPTIAQQARARLTMLGELKKPVVFAPASEAAAGSSEAGEAIVPETMITPATPTDTSNGSGEADGGATEDAAAPASQTDTSNTTAGDE